MTYKYSYKDWINGRIKWMDIETSKYESNVISDSCIIKIRKKQNTILENESEKIVELIISNYALKARLDSYRGTTLRRLIKTEDTKNLQV